MVPHQQKREPLQLGEERATRNEQERDSVELTFSSFLPSFFPSPSPLTTMPFEEEVLLPFLFDVTLSLCPALPSHPEAERSLYPKGTLGLDLISPLPLSSAFPSLTTTRPLSLSRSSNPSILREHEHEVSRVSSQSLFLVQKESSRADGFLLLSSLPP